MIVILYFFVSILVAIAHIFVGIAEFYPKSFEGLKKLVPL